MEPAGFECVPGCYFLDSMDPMQLANATIAEQSQEAIVRFLKGILKNLSYEVIQ